MIYPTLTNNFNEIIFKIKGKNCKIIEDIKESYTFALIRILRLHVAGARGRLTHAGSRAGNKDADNVKARTCAHEHVLKHRKGGSR